MAFIHLTTVFCFLNVILAEGALTLRLTNLCDPCAANFEEGRELWRVHSKLGPRRQSHEFGVPDAGVRPVVDIFGGHYRCLWGLGMFCCSPGIAGRPGAARFLLVQCMEVAELTFE